VSNPQQITVSGGNLFQLAAQYLGSAEQWSRLAQVNGLSDPMISGTITLTIPPTNPTGGNGGILYP
jgi:hypothetical protein